MTYRLADHTTADDARRYRDAEEVEQWKLRDPLIRLRAYLDERKLWDQGKEEALEKRAEEEVAAVVRRAETIEPSDMQDIFDSTFETATDELGRQRDTLRTSSIGQQPEQIDSPLVP
jgi:pyruvate dehydrogenase E1 component alpha subunit